jgi:hypothetical protein
MTSRSNDNGSALPAALFLLAMLALVGAALHLAVATEGQLAVNCLEADRARLAALSAVGRRSMELRRAMARFRVPSGLADSDVAAYRDDHLSGGLTLLEDGISGLVSDFGPWTLDLPLDHGTLSPLDDAASLRSVCHIEPAGVEGTVESGLRFTWRCRVTGEGRSSRPRRHGVAYVREEIHFSILLARFPTCHWQLLLPCGGETVGDPQLFLPPWRFDGPVRVGGRPGFRGTGSSRSGLPRFAAGFHTSMDNPESWVTTDAADPGFVLGVPCGMDPLPPIPPPAAESAPTGVHLFEGGALRGDIRVGGDLERLEVRGEGGEQVFRLVPPGGLPPVEVRVDFAAGVTVVDGVSWPGLVTGPLVVEGNIRSLDTGAPAGSPVPAALAPGSRVTVAALGEIVITGHLPAEPSLLPDPVPRTAPPADDRFLGIFSAGAGQGVILDWTGPSPLCLDAAIAVIGDARGLHWTGDLGQASLFGALFVEGLVQPDLLSRLTVNRDPRLAELAFAPPGWPRGPVFEAYLCAWEPVRHEEISPYE